MFRCHVLWRHLAYLAEDGRARVVDKNVETAELSVDGLKKLPHIVDARHVGREANDSAERVHGGYGRIHPIRATVRRSATAAPSRNRCSAIGAADAARAAGDDGHFSGKRFHIGIVNGARSRGSKLIPADSR